MVRGSEVCEIRAPSNLKSFFHGKPPSLWCRGDLTILDRTLLGIISARQIDSDLTSESSQLLKQLVFMKDVSFVGGWHSPLEEEALRVLLAQEASIIFCVSKGLDRFIPSIEVASRVSQGQALLLTHCSPKAKRITRDASMRRNSIARRIGESTLDFICTGRKRVIELSEISVAARKNCPYFRAPSEQGFANSWRSTRDVGYDQRGFAVKNTARKTPVDII